MTSILQNISNSTMADLKKGGGLEIEFKVRDIVACDNLKLLSDESKMYCRENGSNIDAKSGRYLESRKLHLALATSDKLYLHLPEQRELSPDEKDLFELDRQHVSLILYRGKAESKPQ